MSTKKILYYNIEKDVDYDGDGLYLTTKDYYDKNDCGWDGAFDEDAKRYPEGPQIKKDLEKIGLDYEWMESMVLMVNYKKKSSDGSYYKPSIQEIIDGMAELGWTLLPFPEED